MYDFVLIFMAQGALFLWLGPEKFAKHVGSWSLVGLKCFVVFAIYTVVFAVCMSIQEYMEKGSIP